jgi:hypothetical protein
MQTALNILILMKHTAGHSNNDYRHFPQQRRQTLHFLDLYLKQFPSNTSKAILLHCRRNTAQLRAVLSTLFGLWNPSPDVNISRHPIPVFFLSWQDRQNKKEGDVNLGVFFFGLLVGTQNQNNVTVG